MPYERVENRRSIPSDVDRRPVPADFGKPVRFCGSVEGGGTGRETAGWHSARRGPAQPLIRTRRKC